MTSDSRAVRTRRQIFEAFADLVQRRRYDSFSVADLVAEAGIGRSTFYEHFRDKDAVLRVSLRMPFAPLATLIVRDVARKDVVFALDHFWERRALARIILTEPTRTIAIGSFADLLEDDLKERGDWQDVGSLRADIAFKAHGAIAVLDEWVTGRVQLNSGELADLIFNHAQMRLTR